MDCGQNQHRHRVTRPLQRYELVRGSHSHAHVRHLGHVLVQHLGGGRQWSDLPLQRHELVRRLERTERHNWNSQQRLGALPRLTFGLWAAMEAEPLGRSFITTERAGRRVRLNHADSFQCLRKFGDGRHGRRRERDDSALQRNGVVNVVERRFGFLYSAWGGSSSSVWVSGDVGRLLHGSPDGGPSLSLIKSGTDPLAVVAGSTFGDSIRVLVTDPVGIAKSGVSVTFAVTAGGGSVSPSTVVTGSSGKAAAKFTTGASVAANTATATVMGLTPISYSITTLAAGSSAWSPIANTSQTLEGVWGSSANDVWMVGNNTFGTVGILLHYDGTNLTTTPLGVWQHSVWARHQTCGRRSSGRHISLQRLDVGSRR